MIARSETVGFKRHQDLAEAVGCTREQVARWASMELPPRRMRKGFDGSLARALQTTKQVLFQEWAHVAPNAVDRFIFHPDHFFPTGHKTRFLTLPTDVLLKKVVDRLLPTEVEKVLEYAVQIVVAKHDARLEEFRPIAETFDIIQRSLDDMLDRTPPPP
jgi:hypothetical protein